MTRELLPDVTPIKAGPVVIEDHTMGHLDYLDTHITCEDIAIEALEHGLGRYEAELAMLFAVRGLISHLGLKILPPYEAVTLKDGEVWGPYDPYNYFIDLRIFFESKNVILKHTKESTSKPRVINTVELAIEYAGKDIKSNIDSLPVDALPSAVFSWKKPKKQLEAGNLIEFEEFSKTVYGPIYTSPGKAAEVFDRIVLKLGDKDAVDQISQLDSEQIGYRRRYIRDSLYIKTQALADLVNELSVTPQKDRERFNNLSLKIMRFILNDESPEDHL
jgi:hypothetical protein